MTPRFVALGAVAIFIATEPPVAISQGTLPLSDSLRAVASARSALRDYLRFVETFPSTPPISRNSLVEARKNALALIERLDSASTLSPGTGKVMALRAYAKVVAGDRKGAERVVRETCRGEQWWCDALLGFISHNDGRFADAELQFRRALGGMSREKRCLWDDVSQIMNSREFADHYSVLTCEGRADVTERVWWLAQPLWIERGNERRTEHYSRWVSAEILRIQAEVLAGPAFRTDIVHPALSAILRVNDLLWADGMGLLTGCDDGIGQGNCQRSFIGVPNHPDRFIPNMRAATGTFLLGMHDFDLEPALASNAFASDISVPRRSREFRDKQSQYGELYQSRFGPVNIITDAQFALFPRNGGGRLFVAFDPRNVTGYPESSHGIRPGSPAGGRAEAWRKVNFASNAQLRVGVAISEGAPDVPDIITLDKQPLGPVRLETFTSADSAIVSIEARDDFWGLAARHRFAIRAPPRATASGIAVSDLLLYDATGGDRPTTVDSAFKRMLPISTVNKVDAVGLFWELRGLRVGEAPEFEILVVSIRSPGLFQSIGRSIGLSRDRGTSLIRWRESIHPGSVGTFGETAHSVGLIFRSMAPGLYTIELLVRAEGRASVVTRKSLRVQ